MADALSRLSPKKEAIPEMNIQVHDIHSQFSNSIVQRIREQTASYPEFNAMKEMIHSGWPSTIQQVPVPLKRMSLFAMSSLYKMV